MQWYPNGARVERNYNNEIFPLLLLFANVSPTSNDKMICVLLTQRFQTSIATVDEHRILYARIDHPLDDTRKWNSSLFFMAKHIWCMHLNTGKLLNVESSFISLAKETKKDVYGSARLDSSGMRNEMCSRLVTFLAGNESRSRNETWINLW